MRLIATLLILAVVSVTAARAAAPGAYATVEAASANDCMRLCADDGLCVGFTYAAGACAMWASVPKDPPSQFMLSHRAPDFSRRVDVADAVTPTVPTPPQPAPAQQESATVALLGGDDRSEDIRPRLGGN